MEDNQGQEFYELVYDSDAAPMFLERFPEARIEDASDSIHEGRFEVRIPNVTREDVYPVIIAEGWAEACLGLMVMMRQPRYEDDIVRWTDKAREIRDG